VWAWPRSNDDWHACFPTERDTLTYLEDWLLGVAVFE
jgi:hypothetical protein